MKESRTLSFLIILATYVIASIIGVIIFNQSYFESFYLNILLADVVATVFVYLVGIIFNNASIYDPYWSVTPLVILVLSLFYFDNFHIGTILLIVAISYWAIRLTINWAYTFKNLNHQDWRYSMLKDKTGGFYPLVSLFGIHMFPTLVVYFAIVPALAYFESSSYNPLVIIAFVLCIIAATIQLISDIQIHRFRKMNLSRESYINVGLWKYSRHPNYLGEILMWWGVYLFVLMSGITSWYLIIGAIANTLMFLIVSIPMQEKRLLSYKQGYKEYMENTNKLILWFKS